MHLFRVWSETGDALQSCLDQGLDMLQVQVSQVPVWQVQVSQVQGSQVQVIQIQFSQVQVRQI